ncbi:hypothetical protein N0V83_008017 [Neocucurbitaria cava]|uniref:YDG domain-containing protein n=1 Tax=Neocucurbitaria cava TaxID=798079 RepID=A0A9W8Y4P6_9PLEO|nr:hypothetical protein N0V83_008017 [Neocucurbitaria cava]
MANPDPQEEVKLTSGLPGELLRRARETAALTPSDALARTLQRAKEKENNEAAKRAAMQVLARRLGEARVNGESLSPVKKEQFMVEEEQVHVFQSEVVNASDLDMQVDSPGSDVSRHSLQPEAVEKSKEVPRGPRYPHNKEMRAGKQEHRSKRARLREKRATTPPPLPLPPVAESSSAGANREAVAADRITNIPPPSSSSSSLFVPENQSDKYKARPLPEWYTTINESALRMKELSKRRPQSLTSLEALKECIARSEIERNSSQLKQLHEDLRDYVHKAEITLQVDKYIIKKSRILSPDTGLPKIFNSNSRFLADLKADAYQLYNRWCNEDFEQNILRGIVTVKGGDRTNDRLDQAYKAKHPTTPRFYGEGDLVLGQWWPTQLCTVRDGAHGSPQGGISGEKDKGAYSIVLSGGSGYHDKDDGDTIEYSGTEGKNFTPTENTLHLVKSLELGNPIRVIRSAQLVKTNKYRPELGLRYDGLYTVKGYVIVDRETAMHQFRLERCKGQEKIRCEDNAARRPTIFEVKEHERLWKAKSW